MKRKLTYYMTIAAVFFGSAAVLTIGSAVVTVNCHNAMNSKKIVLFDAEKTGNEWVITIAGNKYSIRV